MAITIAGFFLMSTMSSIAHAGDLANAVASADFDKAKYLLETGSSPDDADYRGMYAILIAASSDQFRIVKLLMDRGANIWLVDKLARNVGTYTYRSRIDPSTDEGRAHAEVKLRLIAAGYPPPPFYPNDVQALITEGRWPPVGIKNDNSFK